MINNNISDFKTSNFTFEKLFEQYEKDNINKKFNTIVIHLNNIKDLINNNNFKYSYFIDNIDNITQITIILNLLLKNNYITELSIDDNDLSLKNINFLKLNLKSKFIIVKSIVTTKYLSNFLYSKIIDNYNNIKNDDFLNNPKIRNTNKDKLDTKIIEINNDIKKYENIMNNNIYYDNLYNKNDDLQNFYYYIMVLNQNKFIYCDNIYNLITKIIENNKNNDKIIQKTINVNNKYLTDYLYNLNIEILYNFNITNNNYTIIKNFINNNNIQKIIKLIFKM